MKKLILTLLVAVSLAGCRSEIDHAETVTRNGLIYQYGDTDPFNGLVVNIPIGLPGISALCNARIEKGRNSGQSECFYNGQKVYEVEYLAGNKDGVERVFDAKSGDYISVKHWKNGRQDGEEEQYLNGILISRKAYKDGKPDGEEIRWSDNGKTVLTKLRWRAGNKQDGFLEDSEGKYNYLNGQLHGERLKYGYISGKLKRYTSAEEHYDNGKLDGVQKKYVNILHTDLVQQESEIIYDKGVARSGWMKKFDPVDGSIIQEIKLTQSPHGSDEDFDSGYPGNLVPDGVLKQEDTESEEVWANGVKVKYSYNYGEPSFHILESTTPWERYREVSQAEYSAYEVSASPESNAIQRQIVSLSHNENCHNAWITAYRNEIGDDAVVTSEQLSEWSDWCREGKLP
ncbi:toxin-antitoxin system YwqK family antitoxin [Stutzerimonas kirkiae]|uniref:toxin-antitoxin system YwqK family antitoxin n=1 Tax=Stutzerimonas kirkiae TaxID=2211392 RepID=UPI001038449F|nr:hypothetical protein [Stutzerimonas kirkiae]TBV17398.1 hypothetical protein DNK01_00605 [Stutzerimonas kirkiae]